MDRKTLVWASTILLACTILGGVFYAIQINKQEFFERRQILEMDEKRRVENARVEQERVSNEAKMEGERKIREATDNCLIEAHERFDQEGLSACLELGYTQQDVDNLKCKLPMGQLKRLEDKQKEAQDFCLKVYK